MTERPQQLFEISWEVCNKVGGIHTVLSSKARTAVQRFGDDYITIGPLLLTGAGQQPPFDDEPGHEAFVEGCRELGLPVRIGRWRIPGRPRCMLIGFSSLYEKKDGILAGLWERHRVDSIAGDWDYVEPVLFSIAAAMVIERWWEEHLAPFHRRAVVHAHEWMTGAALLYLKERIPAIGTVFTTHATMLGRALASMGIDPSQGLGDKTAAELAEAHGVRAKHSMEGACARAADAFTTVSAITADEARLLHDRAADVLVPNGLDLDVVDELAAGDRDAMRKQVADLANAVLGEDVGDSLFVGIAGRYEFYNKGIELLLDALGRIQAAPGRPVVAFVLVPAGNSGVRAELLDRLERVRAGGTVTAEGPIGLCTHNLFDEQRDPLQQHCRRLGIDNKKGARVKVVQVPIYLRPDDGLFDREYEAVLAAMDLGCYPSFYEPWGYTPQEALAVGVPTVTTDLAGFGRWAQQEGLGPDDGVTVLRRQRVPYDEVTDAMVAALEGFLREGRIDDSLRLRCRAAAGRTAWKDLYANYNRAYALALGAVQTRSTSGVVQFRLPRRALPSPGVGPNPRMSTFEVSATVPAALKGLERLARNFWWCWHPGVKELFLALEPELARHGDNPVRGLHHARVDALERLAADPGYLRRLEDAVRRFDDYLAAGPKPVPLGPERSITPEHPIAYFSAEFGVHGSLPIYSGGLGILAGDHLKSASDLALPLLGVGLFYRCGYMQQRVGADGKQIAVDRENDPRELAVEPVRAPDGRPLEVTVPLPGRELVLRAWKAQVGRVPLYLLDANVPQNRAEDRDITRNLYGGDSEVRIQQEIVLGRGGVRFLRALGLRPSVYHMNEGHAAFLTLERTSRLVRGEGLTFEAAREYVAETTLFTTHTPVPAGHDRFGEDLMRRYFGDAEEWVGLPWDRFWALGNGGQSNEFNMTWLAMQFAGFVNGVSKLHGLASQKLLASFWPGLLEREIPVTTVTNGVHLPSWTHDGIADLLRDGDGPVRPADFAGAGGVARGELWRVHQTCRQRMIESVRGSLTRAFLGRGDSPVTLNAMLSGLDDDALYLGFARRFAPYKRAHLLFSDPARLRAILTAEGRPVRIVVAGKAHPRDTLGQEVMQRIVQLGRSADFTGLVLFVEDYDIAVARALVQGVDVWVNTPTRMEEASGTSGMKAAANGVLNLSIADGWWPEAADGRNGWTIGGEQVYSDAARQNEADAATLYRLLEEEIVPLFFERDADDMPQGWLERMAHCLETVPVEFNTDRMVQQYADRAYRPLATRYFAQQAEKKAPARERGREIVRVRNEFAKVRILAANTVELQDFKVGQHLDVTLEVDLAGLQPADVLVELVVEAQGDGREPPVIVPMKHTAAVREHVHAFAGSHRVDRAGRYSHGMRVRARVPATSTVSGGAGAEALRGLVLWA
ncbi:MAG: alpha-glucan family phosphorylase [Planctomycetota bacterium]